MKYFSKLITCNRLTTLLVVGMLLRSIVAVGYMLDTNPDNGDLFSITICEGSAGINSIAGLDNHHTGHHINHTDNTDSEYNHAGNDHPASSCNLWSASSLSLFTNIPLLNTSNYFLSDEIIIYERHLTFHLIYNSRFARAPPTPALA